MEDGEDRHWPTRISDLAMAKVIIDTYASQENGLLRLLNDCTFNAEDETARFTLPPWVEALADAFKSLYGERQYPYILSHVIQCFVKDFVAQEVMTAEHADVFNALIMASFHPDGITQCH